ncbi:MAG TPA: chemotaxis-specific protein-glutamate methyltransferase CheB [Kofleriaceae bacterium]|jgi:two-component system chemotaxis response regulator CheB|nr:chemotaxis-specific protein-glutamate methyltransferase CheB [Kofleriaceae bacterium]
MKPRVLVVDDSAFARTTLAKLLRASGKVEVVGTARDGLDAVARIAELDPDVVTLDLTMPELDGVGVLRALAGRAWPRVIVVSISGGDTELGAEALSLGAVDIVAKPTALASDRLTEVAAELVAKVVAAGARAPAIAVAAPAPAPRPVRRAELALIGTSTGGPQALTQLVAALPADLAIPVAIVLHIPAGYTEALARRLDQVSPLHVVEAAQDLELAPGTVALARAGFHLRVAQSRSGVLRCVIATAPSRQFVPSVDELFESGAELLGPRVLGVILTGMGDDGLAGARAIHARGGSLITESMSTCVVYGMPRVVDEAGLGATSLPLDRIAGEIARRA